MELEYDVFYGQFYGFLDKKLHDTSLQGIIDINGKFRPVYPYLVPLLQKAIGKGFKLHQTLPPTRDLSDAFRYILEEWYRDFSAIVNEQNANIHSHTPENANIPHLTNPEIDYILRMFQELIGQKI